MTKTCIYPLFVLLIVFGLRLESYETVSPERVYSPTISADCSVSVEGPTIYCGKYNVDLSDENDSNPILKRKTFKVMDGRIFDEDSNAFIRTEQTADGLVITLYGLKKSYKIVASSHLCKSSNGAEFSIVDETETKVGSVYTLDPNGNFCDSLPYAIRPRGASTATVDKFVSFTDCLNTISTESPGTKWKEMVQMDGTCRAWDDSLDTGLVKRRRTSRNPTNTHNRCTCLYPDKYFPTPSLSDVNPDCMAIVKDPVLHGVYFVKLPDGDGELEEYPRVVAKKIVRDNRNSLMFGDFYGESEDGYRYIEYDPLTDKQKLKAKNGTVIRDISTGGGFICFGTYRLLRRIPPIISRNRIKTGDFTRLQETVFSVKNGDEKTGIVQPFNGQVLCTIYNPQMNDQRKAFDKQVVECPGTDIVICIYGPRYSKNLVTCLST